MKYQYEAYDLDGNMVAMGPMRMMVEKFGIPKHVFENAVNSGTPRNGITFVPLGYPIYSLYRNGCRAATGKLKDLSSFLESVGVKNGPKSIAWCIRNGKNVGPYSIVHEGYAKSERKPNEATPEHGEDEQLKCVIRHLDEYGNTIVAGHHRKKVLKALMNERDVLVKEISHGREKYFLVEVA